MSKIFLLPSFLCLDAPIVGVVWVFLLRTQLKNESALPAAAALFGAIWAVYLFDRLYDIRHLTIESDTPLRHRFAAKHSHLLKIGFGLGIFIFIFGAIQLPRSIWIGGNVLGGVTLAYYAAFRFFRHRLPYLSRFPWKEITIGLTFTSGIFLCLPSSVEKRSAAWWIVALSLCALFIGNCLKISHTERGYDRRHDPLGFYVSHPRSRPLELTILPLVATFGSGVLCFTPLPFHIPLTLLLTSLLCLFLNRSKKLPSRLVQASVDLALIIPTALILLIEAILVR